MTAMLDYLPVTIINLRKPNGLDPGAWASVESHTVRLETAIGQDDRPLIIGCCKDLVECVARVAIEARGRQVASGEEFDAVLSEAHRRLEHQIGPGIAANAPVRAVALYAKKATAYLRDLRNEYGTGHGRSTVPSIGDEIPAMCVDLALIWCRWALLRLEALIAGAPVQLISDLRSETFSRGVIASRLRAANLPGLEPDDQRALGVAVGQRSARKTFLATQEGVEPAATPDEATWPPAYKEGLVEGLILNHEGQVAADQYDMRHVSAILRYHSDARSVVERLDAKVRQAAWSGPFATNWRVVLAESKILTGDLPENAQPLWIAMIEALGARGEEYDAALKDVRQ